MVSHMATGLQIGRTRPQTSTTNEYKVTINYCKQQIHGG